MDVAENEIDVKQESSRQQTSTDSEEKEEKYRSENTEKERSTIFLNILGA